MNIEELREHCLGLKGVTEGFPFGGAVLVFKVAEKIFLFAMLDQTPLRFNAKCDPEKINEMRERHSCVVPGYHMNKKHWNTIIIDGSASDKLLKEWIDHSYEQVVLGLPQKEWNKLKNNQ